MKISLDAAMRARDVSPAAWLDDQPSDHDEPGPGRAPSDSIPRPALADTVQADTVQANPVQADTVHANPVQANPVQANPAGADPAQADSGERHPVDRPRPRHRARLRRGRPA
jgi:hypothetical protein